MSQYTIIWWISNHNIKTIFDFRYLSYMLYSKYYIFRDVGVNAQTTLQTHTLFNNTSIFKNPFHQLMCVRWSYGDLFSCFYLSNSTAMKTYHTGVNDGGGVCFVNVFINTEMSQYTIIWWISNHNIKTIFYFRYLSYMLYSKYYISHEWHIGLFRKSTEANVIKYRSANFYTFC